MKSISRIIVLLLCLQALLVLFSWIGNAYGMRLHSPLSASGIRWAFSKLIPEISAPYLVWLLLLAAAYGVMRNAGFDFHPTTYRHRLAWRTAFALALLFAVSIIFLAFVPHAVLLNVVGRLYPSPFLSSIVPYSSVFIICVSMLYGSIVGKYHHFSDIISSLCKGISCFAPIIILYLISAALICSIAYVLP